MRNEPPTRAPGPVPTPVVLAVDDLRALPHATQLARTSREGVRLFQAHRDVPIAELWLDHDLGGDESIMPVVTLLEEGSLTHWGYRVRRATAT
ncbi:cyclic-phosphate processing receiver domain-containing protein [Streptomyces sp. NPDC046939]|uniref:cyclic-phosphate processing receiver domain-containing protein n=1 Tax=Streptomyces sp. NPDC046939 TaxID=3155376 RepID=UPI0033E5C86F